MGESGAWEHCWCNQSSLLGLEGVLIGEKQSGLCHLMSFCPGWGNFPLTPLSSCGWSKNSNQRPQVNIRKSDVSESPWESHISMNVSKDSEASKMGSHFGQRRKGGSGWEFQRGNGQFTGIPESGKHILSRQLKTMGQRGIQWTDFGVPLSYLLILNSYALKWIC